MVTMNKRMIAAICAALMLVSCDSSSTNYKNDIDRLLGSSDDTGSSSVTVNRVTETATYVEQETDETVSADVYPMKSGDAPDGDAANGHNCSQAAIVEGSLINGTLIGKDGWMFYEDSLDSFTGGGQYTQAVADGIRDRMSQRLEWLTEQGIKLYFVIAPNKNSVYPEYMPDSYVMGENRQIDQVVSILESAGITVIDGRVPLAAAKEADPDRLLYYKLDTHWNNYGGYVVYQALMDRICEDFPNAVRRTEDEYNIVEMETYMKDQAYNLGYYNDYTQTGPQYALKSGLTATLTRKDEKERWGQFRFSYEYPDGYSDHLYSFGFKNSYISDAPTMFMIRDSFGIAMNLFLRDSFSVSDYSWTTRFERSVISELSPDILIVEVAERNLSSYLNSRAFTD
jgi:hypothetical protein